MERYEATTTTLEESSPKVKPSPIGFLCAGHIADGKFVPEQVCLTTDSLEAEEIVRAYLKERGLMS